MQIYARRPGRRPGERDDAPARAGRRRAVAFLAACGAAGLGLAGCGSAPPPAPTPAPAPPPVAAAPPPPPPPPPRRPRIGLALGGGAARGFAHIGVIQALEESGLAPDLVAGTSAGSLVAALYASGKSGADLAALADTMDETAFADWAYPGRGLIRGEALAKFVRDKTGNRQIEQMKIPLGIAATDLDSGEGILFQRGDTGTAVRASSAVPAVFQPVKIGAREYVDGGLSAPVPVHHARAMGAEFVIAVDISAVPAGQPDQRPGADADADLLDHGPQHQGLRAARCRPGAACRSCRASPAPTSARRKQSIRAGREAALAQIAELRERLAAKSRTLSPA